MSVFHDDKYEAPGEREVPLACDVCGINVGSFAKEKIARVFTVLCPRCTTKLQEILKERDAAKALAKDIIPLETKRIRP